MKKLYPILALIVLLLTATRGKAQREQSSEGDTATGVVVHADPRLALVTTKKPAYRRRTSGLVNMRGFRVQIYSGTDRGKATQTKIDFIRRFPSTQSYMLFVSPQFRVRVGNFRSRADAQAFYNQISHYYTPCMIVPDNVQINLGNNPSPSND